MSAKYIKLILIVCLLLGILLCILGCVSVIPYINLKGNPNSLPVRILRITTDVNQREELFTQLRKFADKHSLEFILNLYSSDNTLFLVEIKGDGFHIDAGDVSNSPREIEIYFFNEASPPTSQETFDKLYDDLKSFLNEIPNVTITEKQKDLRIAMDANQHEELFTQLRKFADKHSLEFTLSFYGSEKTFFLVEIYGDGFHITSEPVRISPGEINIDFYSDINNEDPTPVPQETVDELFNDLKSFLGEIPNVTIVEE